MDSSEIICDGDSWVFGSEIADPEISKRYDSTVHPGKYDWTAENDEYRIPKIFPTFLSKLLNVKVTNLAWPADDNGTILNRTITYITNEYIAKGKSTDNLFVIIGWSSPERNVFYYKDTETNLEKRFRLWPQDNHFDSKSQEDFWKIYVEYLWNAEEYMPRYVMNVLQLQNFCKVNNIKWMCFNSFYQTPNRDITQWNDLNVKEEISTLSAGGFTCHISTDADDIRHTHLYTYSSLWDTIDPIRFYNKDKKNNTFYSFIKNSNLTKPLVGWHPSPEAHELWANELIRYIDENNLLK
jgi:hypothetical protein